MELTASAILGFRTRYETIFNKAYNLAEPQADKAAFIFNGGRVEQVIHRWMQGLGQVREFTDERIAKNLTTAGQTIVNRKWELTVDIEKTALERDQYGIYDPFVSRMGQVAKLHRDAMVFGGLSDLLTGSSTLLSTVNAYDGQPFYGSHTIGTQTFNNKTSGAGSTLNFNNLVTAITALRGRKDSTGNPLAAAQARPLVIVPPALEFVAAQLATNSFIVGTQPGTGASSATSQAAQTENVLKGTFDYMTSPYLKTATEWHVTLADPLYKPMIFQIELEIEFLSPPQFFNNWWSDKDIFRTGTRALYNAAPGLPEMSYGSVGA